MGPPRRGLSCLQAGSTIAEARVTEDQEQDRPVLRMFQRLKSQVPRPRSAPVLLPFVDQTSAWFHI